MLPTLLLVAAAQAGWTPNGAEHGCTFFLGSSQGSVQPVRAECDWPIAPQKLHAIVANQSMHDEIFSTVAESVVTGPAPAGGTLVRQVHVATGMSDREATMVYANDTLPNGTRYNWKLAPTQPPITRVPVAKNAGYWEITAGANGGSHVVYELGYDPGGSVPGFLVRWFQGSGTKTLVGELRKWAETH